MTEQELQAIEKSHVPHDVPHGDSVVPMLIAEVRRLHGLLKQAEWKAGYEGHLSYAHIDGACPWCGARGQHTPECPAFPPVVRQTTG